MSVQTKCIPDGERQRRRRFWREVREDQTAEFIDGKTFIHPPAQFEQVAASTNIAMMLRIYVHTESIGRITHGRLMISLTRNDYEPDICYFGSAKAAKIRAQQMRFPAPDLIVEVLSPSTERSDRGAKMEDYALHGVGEYWIVDPRKQTIEQYVLSGDSYEIAFKGRTGTIKCRIIAGLEIPVRAAFDAKENLRVLTGIVGKER